MLYKYEYQRISPNLYLRWFLSSWGSVPPNSCTNRTISTYYSSLFYYFYSEYGFKSLKSASVRFVILSYSRKMFAIYLALLLFRKSFLSSFSVHLLYSSIAYFGKREFNTTRGSVYFMYGLSTTKTTHIIILYNHRQDPN